MKPTTLSRGFAVQGRTLRLVHALLTSATSPHFAQERCDELLRVYGKHKCTLRLCQIVHGNSKKPYRMGQNHDALRGALLEAEA
jgi:hypothetical protein